MSLPAHLTLRIVTPDRPILEEEVDEVEVPGADGYFGVLPGHTPMLASLQVGELWYRKGAEKHYLSIAFGFAEVMPAQVTILARIAERAEEIDVERAERARRRAEERLEAWFGGKEGIDFTRAEAALYRALNRMEVARKGH